MLFRNDPPCTLTETVGRLPGEPRVLPWARSDWSEVGWILILAVFGNLFATSNAWGQAGRGNPNADAFAQRSGLGDVRGPQEDRFDRIEIEVVFPPPRPPLDGARWAQVLSECGFDRAVLRKATPVDEIQATLGVVAGRQTLQITAGLHQGRLLLPGASFRLNEPEAIRDWVALQKQVRPASEEMESVANSEVVAFGLNAIELVELEQQLSKELTESTLRMTQQDRWSTLQSTSSILLIPSRDSALAMVQAEPVSMELRGLSVGTALAAFGRPLGLVLVPGKSSSGQFQLEFQRSDKPDEYWPIGWPTDQPLVELTPGMFRQTTLDLRGQTVAEALQVIAKQSGVPILLDRNSLLKNGIDVDQRTTRVTVDRQTFHKAMKSVASECRADVQIECRLDEAGKAFFWISVPSRPVVPR